MFGHRPVGWSQHAAAVFAAAFVSSTAQSAIGVLTAFTANRATGGSLGPQPVTVMALAMIVLWIPFFLIVLAQLAIGFTVARAALTLLRQNFGAAYLAAGLVIGMVEAQVVGVLKGAPSPRDFVFAAATGVLAGFAYWLVASRERGVPNHQAQAKSTQPSADTASVQPCAAAHPSSPIGES
jgi:hypothetical protein